MASNTPGTFFEHLELCKSLLWSKSVPRSHSEALKKYWQNILMSRNQRSTQLKTTKVLNESAKEENIKKHMNKKGKFVVLVDL